MQTKKEKKVSEYLHEFNVFIQNIQTEYRCYETQVSDCEKAELDCLHQIELGDRRDRNKATTALHKCLVKRREAKDKLAILQPIKEWLDKNSIVVQLPRVLGEVRRKETTSPRYYYPRIIEDLPISNLKK